MIPRSLRSSTEPRLAPARTLDMCPDTANSQKTDPNRALIGPFPRFYVTEKRKSFTSQAWPVPELTTSGTFGTIEHP